jgi:hypothetical protein
VASSNIFYAFASSFHTPFSCQVSLLSFGPHQEILHSHQTHPNHNVLYAIDKDIFKVINDKQNVYIEISQCDAFAQSRVPHTTRWIPLSPHLSLEVDWMAGQPNAGSCDTEMTGYHHRGKRICGSNISVLSIH